MDQRQTNILLVFLTIILVLYGGYPIINGGYPSRDPLMAIGIIFFAVVITWIYARTSENKPQEIKQTSDESKPTSETKPGLGKSFVGFLIIFVLVGLLLSFLNLSMTGIPSWQRETAIALSAAVLGGVVADVYKKLINQIADWSAQKFKNG